MLTSNEPDRAPGSPAEGSTLPKASQWIIGPDRGLRRTGLERQETHIMLVRCCADNGPANQGLRYKAARRAFSLRLRFTLRDISRGQLWRADIPHQARPTSRGGIAGSVLRTRQSHSSSHSPACAGVHCDPLVTVIPGRGRPPGCRERWGAYLESVLGATPQGFESFILRHL